MLEIISYKEGFICIDQIHCSLIEQLYRIYCQLELVEITVIYADMRIKVKNLQAAKLKITKLSLGE